MKVLSNIKRAEWAGFAISFIGTLPFGVLNILAFTIALNETFRDAVLFSLGVVIVELIYVYICFRLTSKLDNHSKISKWIQPLILLIILAFAFNCLFSSFSEQTQTHQLYQNIPRFLLGLGLSAINAIQIPFWLSWNAFLQEKNVLVSNNTKVITRYLSGIGTGTFFGLMVFVAIAYLVGKDGAVPTQTIDFCLAIILFGTALVMGYRSFLKKV